MLQLFDTLSNVDSSVRLQSTVDLVNHLVNVQSQSESAAIIAHEDVTYAVSRLTRGLASSNDAARQGFATCISELLARLPIVQPEQVLEHMANHMIPHGSTKSEEEKQMYIGQVFTIAALVKSGRLVGRKSLNKRLVASLLSIANKKSYLPEICFHTICELAVSVCRDSKSFSSIVLKRVAPLINGVAPQDLAPELLAFLMAAHDKFGLKVKQFHPQWISEEVLCEQHWPLLMNCFKHSSYTHPEVHMMWPLILDNLFAKGEAHAMLFYRQVVEPAMFGSHVDSRKYLAFILAEQFILRAETGVIAVEVISGPNSRRCMFNHSNKSSTKLFKVASRCLEAFITRGEQDSLFSEQALEEFLISDRWENFDSLTRSKVGRFLASSLDEEDRTQWTNALLEQYRNPLSAGKRKLALESLSHLLKSEKGVSERLTQIVQELAVSAYCETEATFSEAETSALRLHVTNIIGESKSHELAWNALHSIDKNGGGSEIEDWKSVLKEKKRLGSMADEKLSTALSELLALAAFRLLEGNEDEEFVEDLVTSCAEVRKSGADCGAQPMLVLSSLATQLMTESSALYRRLCARAFAALASLVPAEGIMDIVEAVSSDQDVHVGEDGGEPRAMHLEGDDEEHDDEEDEEEDEEAIAAMDLEEGDEEESSSSAEDNPLDQMIPLSDADPEQLRLLDEKIAAVVRQSQHTGGAKASRKTQAAQLADFRCRVLDLYDGFLGCGADPVLLCRSLPALLHRARVTELKADSASLHARLRRTLEVALKNAPLSAVSEPEAAAAINKVLQSVAKRAAKWNPTEAASRLFASVVASCARALGDSLDVAALTPLVAALYRRVLLKKNSRMAKPERFFEHLWRRLPGLGLATLDSFAPLLAQTSKGSPGVKCRAMRALLELLFRSSTGKQWLLDHPGKLQQYLPTVASLTVAWLNAEASRALSSQEFSSTIQTVNSIFNFHRDPRFAIDKNEVLALVQPSEILAAFNAVLKAQPQLLKSKKVTSEQKKLAKTLSRK